MKIKIFQSLKAIPCEKWSQLIDPNFPFSRHEFLLALEKSDSVGKSSGWFPYYITAWEDEKLLGALYLYRKDNSYGEFIFDWDWARAYAQYGKAYYPKLTSAIPFTPATGAKILIHPEADYESLSVELIQAALELMGKLECSSLHLLFITPQESRILEKQGFLLRDSFQYHWKNKNYSNFDDFLKQLKRKRRLQILRERRQVKDSKIEIECFLGSQIKTEHIQALYQFYLSTMGKHLSIPYLTEEFFNIILKTMSDQLLLVMAKTDGQWVAGSINFFQGKNLYGRYWGCLQEFRYLHFELCYYQTIEFAIQHHLTLFEAGAQGSHKIQRGFSPELTLSAHYIRDSAFRNAIADFLKQEREVIRDHMTEIRSHDAYKGIEEDV